jgi:hypothetical protein
MTFLRDTASQACAAIGVALLIAAGVLHEALSLFAGLFFVAISHVLTPCKDQITRWWRERIRQ